MNIEHLKEKYPKIFTKLPEDITELRYLMVIDENYNDVDSEEHDAIDPEDYNYLLYITELVQDAVGEDVMVELVKKLKTHKDIEEFFLSEIDLYGIQTELSEEKIGHMVLEVLEETVA
ncbi:MAG: hypothetical protein COB07_00750 [Sulfurovum sp.]|nr:MAG: hypothetical protein COB07_00750 [Sulfurovum sp.]